MVWSRLLTWPCDLPPSQLPRDGEPCRGIIASARGVPLWRSVCLERGATKRAGLARRFSCGSEQSERAAVAHTEQQQLGCWCASRAHPTCARIEAIMAEGLRRYVKCDLIGAPSERGGSVRAKSAPRTHEGARVGGRAACLGREWVSPVPLAISRPGLVLPGPPGVALPPKPRRPPVPRRLSTVAKPGVPRRTQPGFVCAAPGAIIGQRPNPSRAAAAAGAEPGHCLSAGGRQLRFAGACGGVGAAKGSRRPGTL